MSKFEFELEEFQKRQARVRTEMEKEGVDLLLVISPANIHYLIGSRCKSFQEFQCLFFTLEPGPLTIIMQLAEVAEYTDHSLAEDMRGWGGREPENPIEVVKRVMEEKGYFKRRVGLEVPYYYLDVHDYVKLKDLLGPSWSWKRHILSKILSWPSHLLKLPISRKPQKLQTRPCKQVSKPLLEDKPSSELPARYTGPL